MKAKLILDSSRSGPLNMALDEILGRNIVGREDEFFVRFYSWKPPTLTIGYNQPISDIDTVALERDGLAWVRRMTGGGGVLHWNEVTYSIAIPYRPMGPLSREEIFRFCSRILSGFYRSLGIETEARAPGYTAPIADCFAVPGAYEMVEKSTGKKIAGSASTIKKGYFLQHGSIPIDDSHRRIAEYLTVTEPAVMSFEGSTYVGEFVEITAATARDTFRDYLASRFDLEIFIPPPSFLREAESLAEAKYPHPSWSHRL